MTAKPPHTFHHHCVSSKLLSLSQTHTHWIHLLNLIFVFWCAVKVWILHKCTMQTLGHPAFYTTKSLSHTLLTLGHIAFVLYTHAALNETRTHSSLALGQSCLSAAVCRLSLFPCPVGAPVPPPHWVPALGPAVKRVAPTPLRGGTPTPITRSGRSLALLCWPVPHQIVQQRLPLLRKPGLVSSSGWNPSSAIARSPRTQHCKSC